MNCPHSRRSKESLIFCQLVLATVRCQCEHAGVSKKTKPPEPQFEKGQKVWISKWALSRGIVSATFVQKPWLDINCLFEVMIDGDAKIHIVYGKQFHATKEEAIIAADNQRHKRIKSLQKQIAKLEQLKF